MATHPRILAWRVPWAEEPGGRQFMGSQRVRHDWVTNSFTFWEHWWSSVKDSREAFFNCRGSAPQEENSGSSKIPRKEMREELRRAGREASVLQFPVGGRSCLGKCWPHYAHRRDLHADEAAGKPGGPEERCAGTWCLGGWGRPGPGGRKRKGGRSKDDGDLRRSQQRMELLFNYILTIPGVHLNFLKLDTAMLSFSQFFFPSPLWSTRSKTIIKNRV